MSDLVGDIKMINMKKSFLAMIMSAVIVSDAQAEISDDIVKIG